MLTSGIQVRDPFIVADPTTRTYYLYGTTGFGGADDSPLGFVVRTSKDLAEWSEPTVVFGRPKEFWAQDYYWAPEVHRYRDRWYLFGSFTEGKDSMYPVRRGTQILVSDSLAGPFKPISERPVTPPDWNSIDGTLYVDEAGTPWIVFVREWLQVKDGEMHALQLSPDLTKSVGSPHLLFRASEAVWSLPQPWERSPGCRITDGPWMHRTAAGDLLMIWSTVGAQGYTTGVARSPSGSVLGPWVQEPTPLYAADGGHAMLFRDFNGKLLMSLHTPNAVSKERAAFVPVREVPGGLALA